MAALTILESSKGLECTPLKVILPIASENRAIL